MRFLILILSLTLCFLANAAGSYSQRTLTATAMTSTGTDVTVGLVNTTPAINNSFQFAVTGSTAGTLKFYVSNERNSPSAITSWTQLTSDNVAISQASSGTYVKNFTTPMYAYMKVAFNATSGTSTVVPYHFMKFN